MANDPKRQSPEEIARLSRQAHGVIVGKSAAPKVDADDGATVPVPLMEEDSLIRDMTPPPLPPSPASHAAEVWLEEAATRPSGFTDLASKVGVSSGSIPGAPAPGIDAIGALREAHGQAVRSLRVILVLATVTAFTVGMVLGALLFRARNPAPAPLNAAELCGAPPDAGH